MSKTLVIILAETRAFELTFDTFKKNVIDELNADLCLCIGVKLDYNYDNPFYKLAKYKFLYNETSNDFGEAFDYAYDILKKDINKYEKIENFVKTVKCYGSYDNDTENELNLDDFDDDQIIIKKNYLPDKTCKTQVYGINKVENEKNNEKTDEKIITYRKSLHWREFLKIKNQIMGGIKDKYNQHDGSAGILIFFRWFLLKNLIDNDIISKYDRFVITRSDFIFQLPHPKVESLNKKYLWIPDGESYGGYTDRHAILSQHHIIPYLNILNNFVLKSNDYFSKMNKLNDWNLERLIKFNLEQNNVGIVKRIPYIMYSVRNIDGTTRYCNGTFSEDLGYFIKYIKEFNASNYYRKLFEKSSMPICEFYKHYIDGS